MKKTLVPVGNSLGLIIERPILELLGIGRDSLLHLSTDGRRLIVEPLSQPVADVKPSAVANAPAVPELDFCDPRVSAKLVDDLASRHQMDDKLFRRLHHAQNYKNTLKRHREYGPGRFRRGGTNEQTARRMHECLRALDSGQPWDQAIELAARQYPR